MYDLIFLEEHGEIGLKLVKTRDDLKQEHISHESRRRMPRWQVNHWSVCHALFLVSRQVSDEAKSRYRIKLVIFKNFKCDLITSQEGYTTVRDYVCTAGYISTIAIPVHEAYQAGIVCDNYRGLLSDFILSSVTCLVLHSPCGVDPEHINKDQFPKLEVLENGLVYAEEEIGAIRRVDMDFFIWKLLSRNEDLASPTDGRFDESLIENASWIADEFALANIPSLTERKYSIHVKVLTDVSHGTNLDPYPLKSMYRKVQMPSFCRRRAVS